ncbi:MAG TPA: hypothetical protein VGK67_07240 [Myxococcales bacterium]|jgi:hypothetical protein
MTIRLLAALAFASIFLSAARPAFAGDKKDFEKTVPLPMGGGVVPLGGKVGDVVVDSVNVRNAPNKGDFEKAKGEPRVSCRPKFQVSLTNKGKDVTRVLVLVKILNKDGDKVLLCDTKEKLKPGTKDFKSNLCWLQGMQVNDWPKAKMFVSVSSLD